VPFPQANIILYPSPNCHVVTPFLTIGQRLLLIVLLMLPSLADAAGEREKARLDNLREQRSTLEKQLQHSEDSRREANEELRSAERAISAVGRKLRELGEQRAAARQQLGEQERALGQLERQQQQRQEQLARLLRHQFGGRDSDALAILLAGGDPNQAARDRHFLTLLSRAKAEWLVAMRQDAVELRDVAAQVRARGEQLAELARRASSRPRSTRSHARSRTSAAGSRRSSKTRNVSPA